MNTHWKVHLHSTMFFLSIDVPVRNLVKPLVSIEPLSYGKHVCCTSVFFVQVSLTVAQESKFQDYNKLQHWFYLCAAQSFAGACLSFFFQEVCVCLLLLVYAFYRCCETVAVYCCTVAFFPWHSSMSSFHFHQWHLTYAYHHACAVCMLEDCKRVHLCIHFHNLSVCIDTKLCKWFARVVP